MRKLVILAIAALLLAALPAGAEPVPTPPCASSTEYTTVGIAGRSQSVTPSPVPSIGTDFDDLVEDETGQDVPNVGYHEQSVTRFKYRIDLSGSPTVPAAQTANVTLSLNWDNNSDFDLYVYDAAGNVLSDANGFNPLSGAGETAALSALKHCTDLRIDVVNYAGAPNSVMTLGTSITRLK